jgi:hypothetical protein
MTAVTGRQGSRGIEFQGGKMLLPEDIEAVAQIRVAGPVEQIDQVSQNAIAKTTQPGNILTATIPGEPGSLGEVSAGKQGRHKSRDLGGVGRAVRIDQRNDIPGRRCAPARDRVTLAGSRLQHDSDFGHQLAGYSESVINGVTVDDNDFVDAGRQRLENMRQVSCLVQRRNYDGDSQP